MTPNAADLKRARWTPRERVHVLYLLMANASKLPNVESLLEQMRKLLRDQECQAR